MVTRCSGGSNTALLRFIYRITTALLLAGIYAHALPSNDVVPDVLPKAQLDVILAQVPSGVPPAAQQADGVLAEASPAVLLADPITAAPSTGWPETSCHETKLVWISLMIFFVFLIIMKSCKDHHKDKRALDGKTFIGFSRTEAGFVPDLGSPKETPIEFSADISFRPGANAKNKEFCKSILRACQNVLGSQRPVARAGFGAALTGLLAAYYTEAGSGSDYDKEMEKLSSFYNTVEFLPLLFLGFYCAEEMARLFALMGEISNLSGICVDLSLTLAANYMPPVRSQQDRAWLFKMYRYINLTHWLVYSQLVFGRDDLDIDELVASGLLLKSEKKPFEAASGSVSGSGWRGDSHNVIVAWMTQEYRSKFPRDSVTNLALSQLADISRIGGDLKERATLFYPVLMYNFLMHVFVYGMVFLVAIAFAYDFWVESDCWQMISVTATFFLCWTYFAILRLTESLNMPFDVNNSTSDLLNPEAVLLETEANIFAVLRSGFEGESWTRFTDPDSNRPMSQARYANLQEVAWSTEPSVTELSAAVEVQQD